jgi:hypothetical protein
MLTNDYRQWYSTGIPYQSCTIPNGLSSFTKNVDKGLKQWYYTVCLPYAEKFVVGKPKLRVEPLGFRLYS